MMQIKPGDFGGDKRGIGTLFLHKLQMVRDIETFSILLIGD
jgi:hypothetical protein